MIDKMLIDGAFTDAASGATRELIDPGNEASLGAVPYGDASDARRALDAASKALAAWSARTPYERGAILEKAAEIIASRAAEYAVRTAEESGKPLAQARGEWAGAPGYLRVAAEQARALGGRTIPSRLGPRRIEVMHRPVGVVGIITAWNFPVYNPNRAVASSLAVGCTAVLRPSEFTPRSAFDYARAFVDAGLPAGVLNVVNGDPASMGQAMLDDHRCRKMAFTGSTRVGKLLMDGASRTVKRLSLELGGNAPVIVMPDADVAAVAKSGVTAKLRNAGQVCIAPQRFYVHASVIDAFIAAAKEAAEREILGHALDAKTTLGPLINAAQRDRVARMVDGSVAMGARVVTGASIPDRKGYFYSPTILADVPRDAPALREELFGPVMPVVPFETIDEALAMANDTEYGLAAYVWTRDLRAATKLSEGLDFGMVGVNDWYPVTPEAPFGGVKQSGMGRESGFEGVMEYVEAKTRYVGLG
ncbi:MAG: NAD-dependent succinate-semialdehyde dehydrogenase [Polyangiales bacterium]